MKKSNLFPFFLLVLVLFASRLEVRADEARFQLRVLKPDGTPAVGTKVTWREREPIKAEGGTVADSQGVVALKIPREAKGYMLLDAPGYALRVSPFSPESLKKYLEAKEIATEKLAAAYTISGTTADEKKALISKANLAIVPQNLPYNYQFKLAHLRADAAEIPELATKSDKKGSFSLRGFDGLDSYRLIATSHSGGKLRVGQSLLGRDWVSMSMFRGDNSKPRDVYYIMLCPEMTVHGRVFDSISGQAKSGVKVEVVNKTESVVGKWMDTQLPTSKPSAVTDAHGRFTLTVAYSVSLKDAYESANSNFLWIPDMSLNISTSLPK